jgi:hypothetical protein
MFFRIAGGTLTVTGGPSLPTATVSVRGLAEVTLLRWCAEREEVLATASGEGDDCRLLRWRPGASGWEDLPAGHVHDAVCLGDRGYAVHDGARLAFLDRAGRVAGTTKGGRVNPGPPSLSVSPSGDRVARIRWRGDDRRICATHAGEDAAREYGVSCHRYAWLDDRSLVLYLDGPLRVLDLDTGEASRLLEGVVAAGRGRRFGRRTLDRYLSGRVPDLEESFGALDVAGGRIWFGALLFSMSLRWTWLPRFSGVFTVDPKGGDLRLVASLPRHEVIADVVALDDGSAVVHTERYRRMRVVDRPTHTVGLLASFLAEGWEPMPTSCDPTFDFRLQ